MNDKVKPILTVLLVIASFLGGTMYQRVRMMDNTEKMAEGVAQVTVAPQQQEQAEPTPVVLGVEDRAEIETGGAGIKGNDEAKVVIVEFSEYECPYCKRYVDETYVKLWEEYGDDLKYIFHDYPLEFHQHAAEMANAARCAGEQDMYFEMHDMIFANRDEWAGVEGEATEELVAYASELGLDTDSFRQCVESNKYAAEVQADMALGQKVGVSGTPSFFINGNMLVGAQPYAAFKAVIDAELAK